MTQLAACLEAMERRDIDVIVFGREANARLVADTSRLWLAGTRAFAPGCVVVRASGAVHLLANTDAVAPSGFPRDHLFGITWNPEHLVVRLTAIPGLSNARRLAVDGMGPAVRGLFARAAPAAELVDTGAILAELWALPDPARSGGVTAAAESVRAGLAAMADRLVPGVEPAHVTSAFTTPTPAFESVAARVGLHSSTWFTDAAPFRAGERVVLRAGVLRDGWEASLARTFTVDSPSTVAPPPRGWDEHAAMCRAGTRVGDLRARGLIIYGVGRGVEPWNDDYQLYVDNVVALEVADASGVYQDIVLVTT